MDWMSAGILVALVFASAAEGAFVRPDTRYVWPPGWAEPSARYDVIYDGEGQEANNITVVADEARGTIVITDPLVKMHTTTGGPGVDPLGPRVTASWVCATPGRGEATCVTTPGQQCWSLQCDSIPGVYSWNGMLKIAGNLGDDTIRVLPGPMESLVWGVYGNDVIDVANQTVDSVSCGPGTDQVTADPQDRLQADCELVTRT